MPREVRALNTVGCVVLKELKPSQLCGADGAPFLFYTHFLYIALIFIHLHPFLCISFSWPRAGVRGQGWPGLCIGGIFMHLHPFLCIYTGSQNGCKCRKMGARLQNG